MDYFMQLRGFRREEENRTISWSICLQVDMYYYPTDSSTWLAWQHIIVHFMVSMPYCVWGGFCKKPVITATLLSVRWWCNFWHECCQNGTNSNLDWCRYIIALCICSYAWKGSADMNSEVNTISMQNMQKRWTVQMWFIGVKYLPCGAKDALCSDEDCIACHWLQILPG